MSYTSFSPFSSPKLGSEELKVRVPFNNGLILRYVLIDEPGKEIFIPSYERFKLTFLVLDVLQSFSNFNDLKHFRSRDGDSG